MNLKLSEDLQAFVDQKVASGQYASADEVIETALLELRNIETGELDARWLAAKIETGLASLEIDGGIPAEEAMKKVRQYIDYRTAKVKT